MIDPGLALIGSVATALLAAAAAVGKALTPLAAAVAGVFGIVIVVNAGVGFLGVMVGFVVVSSLATRYRFEEKRLRHVQEGTAGERGVSNVLAHIVLPTALAVLVGAGVLPTTEGAVLFAAAFAFALADTLASEFGVLSAKAVSVLSFRAVAPGTNGGVSSRGELFAVGGSVAVALVGVFAFGLTRTPFGPLPVFLALVAVAGFAACQVDSVLGETLENRGWLTKGGTNFLGMLASIGIAATLFRMLG